MNVCNYFNNTLTIQKLKGKINIGMRDPRPKNLTYEINGSIIRYGAEKILSYNSSIMRLPAKSWVLTVELTFIEVEIWSKEYLMWLVML